MIQNQAINKTHNGRESEPRTPRFDGPGLPEELGDESVLPAATAGGLHLFKETSLEGLSDAE